MRAIVSSLYAFMLQIDERIRVFDRKIDEIFKASEVCQRIAKIRGIGPKTATAMIAAIGDGSDFKNGRHLAAWLGLVPRQHSSGDRRVMMGISKRGSQGNLAEGSQVCNGFPAAVWASAAESALRGFLALFPFDFRRQLVPPARTFTSPFSYLRGAMSRNIGLPI